MGSSLWGKSPWVGMSYCAYDFHSLSCNFCCANEAAQWYRVAAHFVWLCWSMFCYGSFGYEAWSHCIAKTGLEVFLILLTQSLQGLDYRFVPPCLAIFVFQFPSKQSIILTCCISRVLKLSHGFLGRCLYCTLQMKKLRFRKWRDPSHPLSARTRLAFQSWCRHGLETTSLPYPGDYGQAVFRLSVGCKLFFRKKKKQCVPNFKTGRLENRKQLFGDLVAPLHTPEAQWWQLVLRQGDALQFVTVPLSLALTKPSDPYPTAPLSRPGLSHDLCQQSPFHGLITTPVTLTPRCPECQRLFLCSQDSWCSQQWQPWDSPLQSFQILLETQPVGNWSPDLSAVHL